MKVNKRKRITALMCCVIMLLSFAVPASAEGEAAVTVSSVTAAPGEMFTVTVDGSDFECVTALGLIVTYDTNALSLMSASANGCMLVESLNSKTPGFVQYSGISDDGLSGDNSIFSITFLVSESAAEQAYSLSVLVNEASALVDGMDTNISVKTSAGKVTVAKSSVSPTLYFDGYLSATTVETGDDVQLQIVCYSTNGLAAGQFSFTYDSNSFTYKSLELLDPMTEQEYISSINTTNPGQVILAYSADDAISSGYLMTLTLTAKDDASGNSNIVFSPLSLLDANEGTLLYSSDVSANVAVSAKAETPVYPQLWMSTPEILTADTSFVVDVYVEGSSGLAAADFAITYDTAALVCESVSTDKSEDGQGITVIINDDYTNGSINFSMLYGPGISEDTKLISIKFRAVNSGLTETTISSAVSEPKDKNIKPVTLVCGSFDAEIGMSAELEGNKFTLKLPDCKVDSYVVVSWYDVNGRMLGSRMKGFADGVLEIDFTLNTVPAEMNFSCFDYSNRILTEQFTVDLSELN